MTETIRGTDAAVEPGRRRPAPGSLRLLQLFINTYNAERSHLGLRTEEFASPAGLRCWLVHHGLLARDVRVGAADVRRARRAREALRRLALAHNGRTLEAAAVDIINRLAQAGRLVVQVGPDGRMRLAASATGVTGALGGLVAAALSAQIEGTWPRLKACRRCHWAFYDHSKNRSGRWCVMAVCGNRVKARLYRSRHRKDETRKPVRMARTRRG
ncbi:MAG TPA: CGNR zinc finger domain-containing protein [bacterium]|nr:CGNR zinc finger domain-containing protein [bacterium]